MGRPLNPRSIAIMAALVLATMAILALGTAADKEMGDWTVLSPEVWSGEDITVSGVLTIDFGSLHLKDCNLTFTGGTPDISRVKIWSGTLVLEDTRLVAENGGVMKVSGHLELKGASSIEHMDIMVGRQGTLAVRDAEVTFVGQYTSASDNDPLDLWVDGAANFIDSRVILKVAFISSEGTITFTRSSVDSAADFNYPYDRSTERLRFDGGTVSLVDSQFSSLYTGIHSRADLSARDCTFDHARLQLHVPWWYTGLDAWVDGCTFTDSDLGISLEDSNHETKAVDVLVEDVTLVNGHLMLDLREAYKGSIVVDGASISGHTGYGMVVKASGIDGALVLGSLDIDGPWGVQVMHDFSGIRLLNSTIRAEQTALDFIGTYSSIPAYVEGLTVIGSQGIRAKTTVIKVKDSDLRGATVPVRGEAGSAITLTDCLLEENAIELNVEPGERNASVRVDRHLDIGSVRWSIGDPIEVGTVFFYVHSGTTPLPVVKTWPVGSEDLPLIQLLEWTMDDQGEGDRLVYDDVEPFIHISGTTFETEPGLDLDPWDVGPFHLVFLDDVNPWLLVAGDVPHIINTPYWLLHGTMGDAGTGIDDVSWLLYDPEGELVSSGEVDYLSDGRWQTTLFIPGNSHSVHLVPRDRSGNDEVVPLQPVVVDVPTPLLTVVRPETGLVTNVELITVSGTADFYADQITIQVLGHTEYRTVRVVAGRYSTIFKLPQEGLNDLIISSVDPYEGFDEKRISVYLDTIAPAIILDGLSVDTMNHVNNPSLVISGTTDDPRAVITVLGQDVGIVGKDFATTVSLANGPQTIKVKARDDVGNENLISLRVTLDTLPPLLILINPETSPFWSTEYEVEVVLEVDEELASATVNGEAVDVTDGLVSYTVRLGSGPYEVNVRVTDLAGNEAERLVVLRLDNEPPTLIFISPRPGQVVNTTAVPMVVVTSEAGCSLFIDDGVSLVPVDTSENDIGRLKGIMYLPSGEGPRTLTVVIRDRAGNTVSKDLAIDVDTVIPFISVLGLYDGKKVTTEPLKVKGFTEPDSRVVWVNDQMATLSPDGEFTVTLELEEGWQVITFVVIDRAGNTKVLTYNVKALGEPNFDPPVTALAAFTILVTLGAMAVTTEAGRWSLMAVFIPLYTKLRKDTILNQRTRGLIEGYITANPGCNYTIIRDNLDLADGTLTYHLQVLEREGFVYSIREGLFRCFYPQGVPPPRRGKLHLSDTQADLVRIVKRIPGITVGEIATAMNRRPNVISYHLKLLKEGGLLRMEEDGRHVRVYPIDTAVAMI